MDESSVIDPNTQKYLRYGGQSRIDLELFLNNCYNVPHTLIATSGMHAITTSIISSAIFFKKTNINIIYSNELYCDTPRFIESFSELYFKATTWVFSVENNDSLLNILKETNGENHILFVESISNPNSRFFDFSIIPKLRELSNNLIIIIDNTWITHLGLNPFDYDVDIVVASLTKYYSGGTVIAGALMFKNNLIYDIAVKRNVFEGVHISQSVLKQVLVMASNMHERIKKSSDATCEIIRKLQNNNILDDKLTNNNNASDNNILNNNNIIEINHPSINQTNSFLKNNIYPSVFSIKLNCTLKKFNKIMKKIKKQNIIPLITSFGSEKTKLDPYPLEIDEKYVVIRFAIGYLDKNNIDEIVKKIFKITEMTTDKN